MKWASFLLASMLGSVVGFSQPQASKAALRFDAFALKPYQQDPSDPRVISNSNCHGADENRPNSTVPRGRCIFRHQNIRNLLLLAYPTAFPGLLPPERLVTGGPSWIDSSFFSGEAAAEDPETVTIEQLRQMVVTMLRETFQLEFHKETIELSGYFMVPGKNGLKLKPPSMSRAPAANNGVVSARGNGLASLLSQRFHTLVVNKTGAEPEQLFDFSSLPPLLEWDSTNGSLFSALEDLGVKLEPQKIPVETIVIDRAEKPIQ